MTKERQPRSTEFTITSFRLPKDIHDMIGLHAIAGGMTKQEVLISAVLKYAKSRRKAIYSALRPVYRLLRD